MEYDKATKNRLKRIQGQINGILNMMEQEKDCKEIMTQLSATRKGIDRVMGVIVSTNLEQCVRENIENDKGTETLVKEAVDMLIKSR